MLDSFGAPVIEPQGKVASRSAPTVVPGASRAVTVLVICQRSPTRSTSNIRGTATVPATATLLRSLRSRSTIMRFSARFFGLEASPSGSVSAGAVPFMGRAVTVPPSTSRNSSGERLSVHGAAGPGRWASTPKAAGWRSRSAR